MNDWMEKLLKARTAAQWMLSDYNAGRPIDEEYLKRRLDGLSWLEITLAISMASQRVPDHVGFLVDLITELGVKE